MIEVRCCHELSQALPLRDALNALNLASPRPDPFSTFEFYDNYLRSSDLFPQGGSLWLLLAFRDQQLLGYLALKHCLSRVLGMRAAKLDLLTAHVADRPHPVARAEDIAAVSDAFYRYLLSRKRDWSLLEFQQQDAESPLLPPPAAARSGLCQFQQWPNEDNGTIALCWSSLTDYYSALSKKARSNVGRQMRALLAAGEVEVLTSADPQVIAALFELHCSIEARSWKAQTDAAFSRDHKWTEYYTGLMDPAQPMQLVIQVLLLDGVPIAGLISGAFDKGLYALHIVYDDRLAALAPGSAMLLMGMRLAIAGPFDFFNLLWGYGYYKTRWLAEMSTTQSLQIYRIGSPFFWRRLLGDIRRRWSRSAVNEQTALNNPARLEIARAEPLITAQSVQLASADERAHYASLIARVRSGEGEFLSSTQLAAAMPFATQRGR